MIEAVIAATLAKIGEGTGTALVELIRHRFVRQREPQELLDALDHATQGRLSDEQKDRLRTVLVNYAAKDPELLHELNRLSTPGTNTNVVSSSVVGRLVQAQNVGDITM